MSLLFKLFIAVLVLGYANGQESDDRLIEVVNSTTNEIDYMFRRNAELIYYSKPGRAQSLINMCKDIDAGECRDGSMSEDWFNANYNGFLSSPADAGKWLLKQDIMVVDPMFVPGTLPFYNIDVLTYYFPSYTMYANNSKALELVVLFDRANTFQQSQLASSVRIIDVKDRCRTYRPRVMQGTDLLNMELLINRKWMRHAYFFIKNDEHVCAYTVAHKDLFEGNGSTGIAPISFTLIDNYPTEYYAPNFFCVDPLYGTFVSLYWTQQSSPEAHYFLIDERNLSDVRLIDRMVLHGFDEAVLKDIFDGVLDAQFYPTFSSFGRSVFVWFKRASEERAFNGYWKNDTAYEVHFEELASGSLRKLWRSKNAFIQIHQAVGRYDAPFSPPTITVPPPPPTIVPLASSNATSEAPPPIQCPNREVYVWVLRVLVGIDVFLAIVIMAIIILAFRGSAKRKAAMARKDVAGKAPKKRHGKKHKSKK